MIRPVINDWKDLLFFLLIFFAAIFLLSFITMIVINRMEKRKLEPAPPSRTTKFHTYGKMRTIEHEGHELIVLIEGQYVKHFIHHPSCPCQEK